MKKSVTLILALVSAYISSAQTVSFIQAPGSPISNTPNELGISSKDLNNDGFTDLVVGNAYSNDLYLYFGTGTGQFNSAPGSTLTVVNGPISNAVADFNNDNKPDIATANYGSANVSVFLGNGAGTFTQAANSPISTGAYPYYIVASDVNLDGNMDLISCNTNGNNIYVLMGNGAGSFSVASGSPITAGGGPYHVCVGFLNSDAYPDFAVANGNSSNNTISVFFGAGNGSFTSGTIYSVGSNPRTISISDFNNDGSSDMVVANSNSNNLSILLGSSTGVFTAAPVSPVVGSYPYHVITADFDQNGSSDIAVTNGYSNSISILFGNGNGTFTNATGSPVTVGNQPYSLITDDFNGDGNLDLATGDWAGSQINVLINKSTPPACNLMCSFNYSANPSGLVSYTSTSTGTVLGTTYSWNFGDNSAFGTGAAPAHSYSTSGTYTVILTANNNVTPTCRRTISQSVVVQVANVGIQALQGNDPKITISPNPTSGLIQLDIPVLNPKTEITFFNILGEQVLRSTISLTKSTLNLDTFKNGIYYYKLSENGKIICSGQIILNK